MNPTDGPRGGQPPPPDRYVFAPESFHHRIRVAAADITVHAQDLARQAEYMRLVAAEVDSEAQPTDHLLRKAATLRSIATHFALMSVTLSNKAGAIETLVELVDAGEDEVSP